MVRISIISTTSISTDFIQSLAKSIARLFSDLENVNLPDQAFRAHTVTMKKIWDDRKLQSSGIKENRKTNFRLRWNENVQLTA